MLTELYKFTIPWAVANKGQIFKNRILGRTANYIYPIYCKARAIKCGTIHANKNIIISLTTYPARIDVAYYCINSLLRQKLKADHVILWLAHEQFPNRELDLPKRLVKLCDYGLQVRFCNDLKSYKKIFYTGQEFSSSIIVTADDDTLYPEDWLLNLYQTYLKHPDCIVCYRAHEILFNGDKILPYRNWNSLSKNLLGPSLQLIPIGVGGIMYPVHFFDDIEFDYNIIKKYAPTTDDIWLKVLEIKKRVPTIKVNKNSKEWFTLKGSQASSLKHINVESGDRNDKAIELLMEYYKIDISDFQDRCMNGE